MSRDETKNSLYPCLDRNTKYHNTNHSITAFEVNSVLCQVRGKGLTHNNSAKIGKSELSELDHRLDLCSQVRWEWQKR